MASNSCVLEPIAQGHLPKTTTSHFDQSEAHSKHSGRVYCTKQEKIFCLQYNDLFLLFFYWQVQIQTCANQGRSAL